MKQQWKYQENGRLISWIFFQQLKNENYFVCHDFPENVILLLNAQLLIHLHRLTVEEKFIFNLFMEKKSFHSGINAFCPNALQCYFRTFRWCNQFIVFPIFFFFRFHQWKSHQDLWRMTMTLFALFYGWTINWRKKKNQFAGE